MGRTARRMAEEATWERIGDALAAELAASLPAPLTGNDDADGEVVPRTAAPPAAPPHGRGDGIERGGDLARVVRDGAGVRLRCAPRRCEARVAEGEGGGGGGGVAPAWGAEESEFLDFDSVAEEDGASPSGECWSSSYPCP